MLMHLGAIESDFLKIYSYKFNITYTFCIQQCILLLICIVYKIDFDSRRISVIS